MLLLEVYQHTHRLICSNDSWYIYTMLQSGVCQMYVITSLLRLLLHIVHTLHVRSRLFLEIVAEVRFFLHVQNIIRVH